MQTKRLNKEYVKILILMSFLGNLAGLFYMQMFELLRTELHLVISLAAFGAGLMLLNLIIELIMPLKDYYFSHPIRMLGYLVFIVFFVLTIPL
ncbi:hypothetical protein [Jeotgalibacillus proteolyticus]|uniref:Uncharacterized protein n=1 Tax=Jeotgalibacillus proteolyticus TaxID=2082395 RepID=A0A2S5GA92_9BACL|nr:hypothetical protein [Jeotgalibacillus proteolyticus]PPA69922.1 hypothetical protein C4B60_15470 [Jeotgalibacillus proteolyticus]